MSHHEPAIYAKALPQHKPGFSGRPVVELDWPKSSKGLGRIVFA
jgi:hypothetical protein